ncbi:MAG: M15 family metallopeptidase [Kofleriaceae bacterium]
MRIPLLISLVAGTVAACGDAGPDLGQATAASTVGDHETTTCSTSVVLELSRQIAAEVGCLNPGQLVPFPEGNGVVFAGAAVLPYASEAGRADLLDAVAAGGGLELQLTSAYRTVAQQYLLYRWYQLGRCGIPVAAAPGSSNHESGRAIDVANWDAWVGLLGDHGWAHDVPGDDVHFDHAASPDLRGTDVLAFQRLWNRNHPELPIDEDSQYGPMTAMALAAAPAEGFVQGPSCPGAGLDVAVVGVDAPRTVVAGQVFTVAVTVRNIGVIAWPAGAALVTAEPIGRASPLAAASWPRPDQAAALDAGVAPGATATFAFDAWAPAVDTATEYAEAFTLAVGTDHVGAVALVVTVTPGVGGGDGCSTGGRRGGLGGGLIALALVAARRRRR